MMSQTKFVPLETAQHIDEKLVVPKAAGLVRLGRIGKISIQFMLKSNLILRYYRGGNVQSAGCPAVE